MQFSTALITSVTLVAAVSALPYSTHGRRGSGQSSVSKEDPTAFGHASTQPLLTPAEQSQAGSGKFKGQKLPDSSNAASDDKQMATLHRIYGTGQVTGGESGQTKEAGGIPKEAKAKKLVNKD